MFGSKDECHAFSSASDFFLISFFSAREVAKLEKVSFFFSEMKGLITLEFNKPPKKQKKMVLRVNKGGAQTKEKIFGNNS